MSDVDWPAALDLAGTLLSILGGILAVVPAFRDARFQTLTDGLKSWIGRKDVSDAAAKVAQRSAQEIAREEEERQQINASLADAEQAVRDLRNSNVACLKWGIILLTAGLALSLPAKWEATVKDPCAAQAKCQNAR